MPSTATTSLIGIFQYRVTPSVRADQLSPGNISQTDLQVMNVLGWIYALGDQIIGTAAADTIDGEHSALGQGFATNSSDTIYGMAGDDYICGLGGDDILNGGTGADHMVGGTGNDTYVVDNAGDVVDETGGDGTDKVLSWISFSLADPVHAVGAIENLTLLGVARSTGPAMISTTSSSAISLRMS